jgi:phosphoribosylamine--glycine ligase
LFFLSDGERCARFPPARDYKALADGDKGPIRAAWGAFAPAPLDPVLAQKLEDNDRAPDSARACQRGRAVCGLLYMVHARSGGREMLEYNVRSAIRRPGLMPLVANDLGALFAAGAKASSKPTWKLRGAGPVGRRARGPSYTGRRAAHVNGLSRGRPPE